MVLTAGRCCFSGHAARGSIADMVTGGAPIFAQWWMVIASASLASRPEPPHFTYGLLAFHVFAGMWAQS